MRNLTDFAILHEYERIKKLGDQTAAAHPRSRAAGYARRRRMKMEKVSRSNPKLETYAFYPRSRAAGYYGQINSSKLGAE
jgi:hypothetical protein